jgi:hypothetical protein
MNPNKLWRSLQVGLAALGLAGCATDSTTAPPVVPTQASPALLGTLLTKHAVNWKWEYKNDITVSATIDASGGTITMPGSGFTLVVPPKAVTKAVKFSVTAVKGKIVAFEFAPHGMKFPVALIAKQNLDYTSWNYLQGVLLQAGYFSDRTSLFQDAGLVLVSETISGTTSLLTHEFTWPIKHFSGYAVAW